MCAHQPEEAQVACQRWLVVEQCLFAGAMEQPFGFVKSSTQRPVGEDDSASFGDLFASNELAPDEQVELDLTEKALRDAVADLSEREQSILNLRYGLNGPEEPKSLEEIGRILGITRERVRQLEAEALRRLAERREIAAIKAA